MSTNLRRVVLIVASITSGGSAASNTAEHEWFFAGLSPANIPVNEGTFCNMDLIPRMVNQFGS